MDNLFWLIPPPFVGKYGPVTRRRWNFPDLPDGCERFGHDYQLFRSWPENW